MSVDALMKLKSQIDDAVLEQQRVQGQMDELLRQLKSDWDCTTLEEAQEKLTALQTSLNKSERDLDEKVESLRKQFEQAMDNVD
jgi:phage gp29-like protein